MGKTNIIQDIKKILGIGEKLCDKCQHWQYCSDPHTDCRKCEQYGGGYHCKCSDCAGNVEECKYFKPVKGGATE